MQPIYPEAEKYAKIHDGVCTVLGFMNWQHHKYPGGTMIPLIAQLYEYYEIDADKLENERRQMLERLQEQVVS